MGLVWKADTSKNRVAVALDSTLTSEDLRDLSQVLRDTRFDGYRLLIDFTQVDAGQVIYMDLAPEIQMLVTRLIDRGISRVAFVASSPGQIQLSSFFNTVMDLAFVSELIELEQFIELPAAESWLDGEK